MRANKLANFQLDSFLLFVIRRCYSIRFNFWLSTLNFNWIAWHICLARAYLFPNCFYLNLLPSIKVCMSNNSRSIRDKISKALTDRCIFETVEARYTFMISLLWREKKFQVICAAKSIDEGHRMDWVLWKWDFDNLNLILKLLIQSTKFNLVGSDIHE